MRCLPLEDAGSCMVKDVLYTVGPLTRMRVAHENMIQETGRFRLPHVRRECPIFPDLAAGFVGATITPVVTTRMTAKLRWRSSSCGLRRGVSESATSYTSSIACSACTATVSSKSPRLQAAARRAPYLTSTAPSRYPFNRLLTQSTRNHGFQHRTRRRQAHPGDRMGVSRCQSWWQ